MFDRWITTELRRLAREHARQAIKRKGDKVAKYSMKEIIELGDQFLLDNLDLVFAEYRRDREKVELQCRANLERFAQEQKARKHSTIPVQNSGANRRLG